MTSATRTTTAFGLTLGLAAACWVVAVPQMHGMAIGAETQLASFPFFVALWASMMAAMMLRGAAPAVLPHARGAGLRAVPLFVGSYLGDWALVAVLDSLAPGFAPL